MGTFNKIMNKEAGKGGVKCPCCNPYKGKHRKKLHRVTRARFKNNMEG